MAPKPDDGPVTVTRELIICPKDREGFLALVEQLRLIFLRNGAFLFRLDENLEHPGTFRTEMLVSSSAEHLRQFARMTKAETELVERVWAMHAGDEEPVVRHYLPAKRLWTPLGFGRFQKQPERSLYAGIAVQPIKLLVVLNQITVAPRLQHPAGIRFAAQLLRTRSNGTGAP